MTADGYRMLPMGLPDLEEVASLERRAFANPWSLAAFHHEVQHNPYSRGVVVRGPHATLAAYATVWHLQGELLINNIAVAPDLTQFTQQVFEHLVLVPGNIGISIDDSPVCIGYRLHVFVGAIEHILPRVSTDLETVHVLAKVQAATATG